MNKSSDEENLQAQKIIAHMYERDLLAQLFDMRLIEGGAGFARISMTVKREMLNGHGICHGGVTFALADTAFAYACNSRNKKTVALNCLISFSQVVNEGDELTASAVEVVLNKKTGSYDVSITNQKGAVVALFRGASYATRDLVIASAE